MMKLNANFKKRLSFLFLFFFIITFAGACAFLEKEDKRDIKHLSRGELSKATMGELFFSYDQAGSDESDVSVRSYTFSVLAINKREFILKQEIYQKKKEERVWVLQPGVKTYTFPVSTGRINLMDFTFRILSVQEGVIRYERIR